jgi:hypothetical protein
MYLHLYTNVNICIYVAYTQVPALTQWTVADNLSDESEFTTKSEGLTNLSSRINSSDMVMMMFTLKRLQRGCHKI